MSAKISKNPRDIELVTLGYALNSNTEGKRINTTFEELKKLTPMCTMDISDGWSVGVIFDKDIIQNVDVASEYMGNLQDPFPRDSEKIYCSRDTMYYRPFVMLYYNDYPLYAQTSMYGGKITYMQNNYSIDNNTGKIYRELHTAFNIMSITMSDIETTSLVSSFDIPLIITLNQINTQYNPNGDIISTNTYLYNSNTKLSISDYSETLYYHDVSYDKLINYIHEFYKSCLKKLGKCI